MPGKQRKSSDGKAKRLKNLKPFKKGESGNPDGRPAGTPNRATLLKKWLAVQVNALNPITGGQEKLTVEDEVILALITEARKGNVIAIREILDTTYGKQSNFNFNVNPDELRNLSDEQLDQLIAKLSR